MASAVPSRVLVIDDDRAVRGFLCDALESLGYEADGAEGGVQGLALLERRPYDLVITDLRMPNMSGWDIVDAVRGRRPTMPMIMISGHATEDDVRRAQRAGLPLVQKPFRLTELRRLIRDVLPSGGSQSESRRQPDVPRKPLTKSPEDRQQDRETREDQG